MALLLLGPSATFVAVAGAQNDVTPAPAIGTLNRLLVDTTAGAATFTGLVAGADGQLLWVRNIGANLLTLANANAASAVANRFSSGAVGDLTIPGGDSLLIYWDVALIAGGHWIIGV